MDDLANKLRELTVHLDKMWLTGDATRITQAADELDARDATIEALQKQVAELKGRLPENVGLAKWNAKEPTQ
jgi:hypothetical protein